MAIYEITNGAMKPLEQTDFHSESILERAHLQEYLKKDISIIGEELLVITDEFSQWSDSQRRIDLLCIDSEANLVVIELKRTEDGGHMELQALRYAAMVSPMAFDDITQCYAQYEKLAIDDAQKNILSFLKWEAPDEQNFAEEVRIILCSANFSKELTTSVIWLNSNGLNIKCVRLRPYRMNDKRIMIDVQQIIPLPEASFYQTSIRSKETAQKKQRVERHEFRELFWTELLNCARPRTNLHANRKAGIHTYIGGAIGRTGFGLNYATTETESRVELYIDLGQGQEKQTLEALHQLKAHQEKIEAAFGAPLDWQELPDSRACRIRYSINGGWRSPKSEWPALHENMVDAMIRLDKAIRPYVNAIMVK